MAELPNPFMPADDDHRFVLDEAKFMAELEALLVTMARPAMPADDPSPVFLSQPSPAFLAMTEFQPIVELLQAI